MLCYIKISDLGNAAVEENVGRFDVAMDNIGLVQLAQAFQDVMGDSPDFFLWDAAFDGLGLFDFSLNHW